MFVGAANEQNIFVFKPQVTCINIGRYINPGQVTDVDWPVGIRQRRGDQSPFKFPHVDYLFAEKMVLF
jgi:hypothetical protein